MQVVPSASPEEVLCVDLVDSASVLSCDPSAKGRIESLISYLRASPDSDAFSLVTIASSVRCSVLSHTGRSFLCGRGYFVSSLTKPFWFGHVGRRAADSLSDPGVAAYTADLITDGVIRKKPDLIAFRPVLLSVTESLVLNKVFRSVVERAAQQAHEAAVSEGSQRVLLSIPDLNILVREALRTASPGLAAKIPANLDSALGGLTARHTAAHMLTFMRTGKLLRGRGRGSLYWVGSCITRDLARS